MGRGDAAWLWPVGAITALEVAAVFYVRAYTGYADLPPFRGYMVLALVLSLGAATVALLGYLLWLFGQGEAEPTRRLLAWTRAHQGQLIPYLFGFQVIALSLACLTGLKSMLTFVSPFWADPLFADLDRVIFGTDPWRISHAFLGPATPVIDQIYGFWIPIKAITMLAVIAAPPSRLKAQAMISQAVMWALLGMVLAYVFSSAGPLFYERVTGAARFTALPIDSSLIAGRVSEMLWAEYASGQIAFGSGISAMPSMHVAFGVWTAYILARFGRPFAVLGYAYALIIFVGSVHLGWHYVVDGIVSVLGAIAIWKATGVYLDRREGDFAHRPMSCAGTGATPGPAPSA
jgi:hypothetical protein